MAYQERFHSYYRLNELHIHDDYKRKRERKRLILLRTYKLISPKGRHNNDD